MNSMQEGNRLYKALYRGTGPTFGTWQMLPGTNLSRAIARSGVDWICIDQEHGNIDDGQMHESVAAIAACGVSPIVRIPATEAWMVKRALDAGAHAIVVPLIYSVSDAEKVVWSAKFPPDGTRGFGSPFSPSTFTTGNNPPPSLNTYLTEANSSIITILQIETFAALQNVRAIAALPGVDVLLIGPFDLGNNLGRPIGADGVKHPELVEAIETIKTTAHEEGKKVAIYCTSAEQARWYGERGYDMISIAGDAIVIPQAYQEALKIARGGKGDEEA